MINGATSIIAEKKPLIAPNAKPISKLIIMHKKTGKLFNIKSPQTTPDTAATEPTDKSMHPSISKIVIKIQINILAGSDDNIALKLETVKKLGLTILKKTIIRIFKIMTGISFILIIFFKLLLTFSFIIILL
jgi:hypothetical protein